MSGALQAGKRIFFIGAGSSGRLCVMEAAECPPTFGIPRKQVQAVIAGGNASVFYAREGAEDDPWEGARQLYKRARQGDIVVGVAASGVTPFVQGGLRAARRRKCATVLVTSNSRPGMPEADIIICPRVGPEIIAGSTRLKSGTAAKLVLNTLTTTAMTRLGKVYDGFMVDLKPTSRKLRLRSVRIVCQLGGIQPVVAEGLLRNSKWSVKTAIVAAKIKERTSTERIERARKLLETFDGSLRRTLDFLLRGK
jgi:N-acetylmuramic acid 6-phosphate etherase